MTDPLFNPAVFAALKQAGIDLSDQEVLHYQRLLRDESFASSKKSKKFCKSDKSLGIQYSVLALWDEDNKTHTFYLMAGRLDPSEEKITGTRIKEVINLATGECCAVKITCRPSGARYYLGESELSRCMKDEHAALQRLGYFSVYPYSRSSRSEKKIGDTHYLIMKKLGEDLFIWLVDEKPSSNKIQDIQVAFSRVLKIIGWMFSELEKIHRLGEMHCDVKLENFCVIKVLKVIVALQAVDVTDMQKASGKKKPKRAIGTASYAPPEWFKTGKNSQEGDMYSLGVSVMKILTNSKTIAKLSEQEASVEHAQLYQLFILAMRLMKGLPEERTNISKALEFLKTHLAEPSADQFQTKRQMQIAKFKVEFLLDSLSGNYTAAWGQFEFQGRAVWRLKEKAVSKLLKLVENKTDFWAALQEPLSATECLFLCELLNDPNFIQYTTDDILDSIREKAKYFASLKNALSSDCFFRIQQLITDNLAHASVVLEVINAQGPHIEKFLHSDNLGNKVRVLIGLFQRLEKAASPEAYAFCKELIRLNPRISTEVLRSALLLLPIISPSASVEAQKQFMVDIQKLLTACPLNYLIEIDRIMQRSQSNGYDVRWGRALLEAAQYLAKEGSIAGVASLDFGIYAKNLCAVLYSLPDGVGKSDITVDIKALYRQCFKASGSERLSTYTRDFPPKQLLSFSSDAWYVAELLLDHPEVNAKIHAQPANTATVQARVATVLKVVNRLTARELEDLADSETDLSLFATEQVLSALEQQESTNASRKRKADSVGLTLFENKQATADPSHALPQTLPTTQARA